jgi:hypothetical protein
VGSSVVAPLSEHSQSPVLSFVEFIGFRLVRDSIDQPDDLGLIGKKLPTIKEGLQIVKSQQKPPLPNTAIQVFSGKLTYYAYPSES